MTDNTKGYQPDNPPVNEDSPQGTSEPVTMTPQETIAFQADLLAEAEQAIECAEEDVATYRAVNEAQTKMLRAHLETIQAQRAALMAAKEWLEDKPLRKMYDDCHIAVEIPGEIDYIGPEDLPVQALESYCETLRLMNDGFICWEEEDLSHPWCAPLAL